MTYGFRPENWPAFEHELRVRGIAVTDIEKVEMGTIVTVTLRSGRVESWRQEPAVRE